MRRGFQSACTEILEILMKVVVVMPIPMTVTPHLTARASILTLVMLRTRLSLCVRARMTLEMMVLRMKSTSHSFSLTRGRTRMQMAGKTATCLAAAAITVHKSQGMSLAFFQALFGESELALGCTYVQLSRATALVGLVLRDVMTLKRLIGLSRSDRADQRCAFDLKCDAGAIASLKAARAVSGPGSADEIALDAAITAAEGELEQARATLKSRLDAKSQAAAAKAAGSRKKPRLAAGAAAAGAAQ